MNPLFKRPTIPGFWTPASGLQNPSGISGPALPPWFGQDPWPEPNPSSFNCQDAYRRSTCWAAHWAANPHPHAALECRVRKGHGEARLQSGGEPDRAKNRLTCHPTRLGVFLATGQGFSGNLQETSLHGSIPRKDPTTRPFTPKNSLLLRPYFGPPSAVVDIFSPRKAEGDGMTRDTPSVLQQVRSLTLISRQKPLP